MVARTPIALDRRGLACVILLHAAVFWGLLQINVVSLLNPLNVLTVSLLPPAEEIKLAPEIAPPLATPVERRPTLLPQPVALAAPAEVSHTVPSAAPASAPMIAATAPSAPTPPRFDADYLDNPKPPYPGLSRKLNEQGRVVLRVHVDANGLPLDVQLHSSSGFARLDHSALETVRRWKFVPARFGNDAVAATVLVPIAFSLKD